MNKKNLIALMFVCGLMSISAVAFADSCEDGSDAAMSESKQVDTPRAVVLGHGKAADSKKSRPAKAAQGDSQDAEQTLEVKDSKK